MMAAKRTLGAVTALRSKILQSLRQLLPQTNSAARFRGRELFRKQDIKMFTKT